MTEDHFVIRVRGLPWHVKEEEVEEFFSTCSILGGTEGIHFTKNR
jgi:hypothetical protein